MTSLLKYEIFKLLHNKPLRIVLMFYSLLAVLTPFMVSWPTGGADIFVTESKDIMPWMLCCALFAAFFIGSDFTKRVINNELTAGKTRFLVYTSKSIVYLLVSSVITLEWPLICMLITTIIKGWGIPNGFSTTVGTVYVIKVIIANMLLSIGTNCIFLCIAFLMRKPGWIIGASVAFLVFVIPLIQSISEKNAILARLYSLTSVGQVNSITEINNPMIKIFSISLITLALFYIIGYLFFKRADFK